MPPEGWNMESTNILTILRKGIWKPLLPICHVANRHCLGPEYSTRLCSIFAPWDFACPCARSALVWCRWVWTCYITMDLSHVQGTVGWHFLLSPNSLCPSCLGQHQVGRTLPCCLGDGLGLPACLCRSTHWNMVRPCNYTKIDQYFLKKFTSLFICCSVHQIHI